MSKNRKIEDASKNCFYYALTEREIAVASAKNLADFQQPRKIFVVDEIPKNAMGKIVRRKLMDGIFANAY